jgi:16S rRNA processing protein RimM
MAPTADSTSSTERVGPGADDLAVGRVVGAHGLRGELRVRTGSADALTRARLRVRLVHDEGEQEPFEAEIARVRPGREGECRLALVGVESREAADALRGSTVWVKVADLPALAPGEFYQHQLVGCRVEDATGRPIGIVRAIWETGASDVLVIEDAAGREVLTPAADSLLREVDLAGRRLVIEVPPGLLEED